MFRPIDCMFGWPGSRVVHLGLADPHPIKHEFPSKKIQKPQ